MNTTTKSFKHFSVCLISMTCAVFWADAAAPVAAKSNEIQRLSFFRMGLLYETGTKKSYNPDQSYSFGPATGVDISVNPPYNYDSEKEPATLGWSLNCVMGYNFKEKQIRPYVFNTGFWGAYMFNDNLELGLQWCFLGVYGYQDRAHFGSHISPAIRIQKLQIMLGRSGAGAIIGCFKPRFNDYPQHYIEASYFVYEGLTLGGRYTAYRWGVSDTREIRIFVAMNMGMSFRR